MYEYMQIDPITYFCDAKKTSWEKRSMNTVYSDYQSGDIQEMIGGQKLLTWNQLTEFTF